MSQTNINKTNYSVPKAFGVGLFAGMQKSTGDFRNCVGKVPAEKEVLDKVGKQQSEAGMPIVEIRDLSQTAGQTVSMDCLDVVSMKPIMGDKDAEGKGAKLSFSTMEIDIDQWTFAVSAGGKMSQQRTPHNLRKLALATGRGMVSRAFEERTLYHLAGARGDYQHSQQIVPLASDPDFDEILVNKLKAPTYNRHYVVNGNNIERGGAGLASIDATDTLKLDHIDALRNVIDNLELTLQPVKCLGDLSSEPMYVMYVPADVYSSLLRDGQMRAFQQHGINRASTSGLMNHPLFKGEFGMWNGILVKKIQRPVRFNAGSAVKHVAQADQLTANETDVTVNPAIGADYAVNRCLLLGAQALGIAYGKDSSSGTHYSYEERKANFGREYEFGFFGIEGAAKVRFDAPNADGEKVPTDHGVIALDVVAKKSV